MGAVRTAASVTTVAVVAATLGPPAGAAPRSGQVVAADVVLGSIGTTSALHQPNGDRLSYPTIGGVFVADFAPDGQSLAYDDYVAAPGDDDLTTLEVIDETGATRVVFDRSRYLREVSWSPDGERLALATANYGQEIHESDLWIVPADGVGEPERVFASDHRDGEAETHGAAWSPDGSVIAYEAAHQSSETDRYESDIWLYDVGTGTSTQLTHQCTWDAPPPEGGPVDCADETVLFVDFDWSPDGDRLVATTGDELVTVSRATGEIATLREVRASSVRWSPDGQWVAYAFRSGVWKAPVAGGDPVLVTDEWEEVLTWQGCATTCPVIGREPAATTLAVKPRVRARVEVEARLGPRDVALLTPERRLRLVLRIRTGGRTKVVRQTESLPFREDTLVFRAPKPATRSRCTAVVTYAGSQDLSPARASQRFRC